MASQANGTAKNKADRISSERSTLSGSYLASTIAVAGHDTAAAAYYFRKLLMHDPRNNEMAERAFIAYLADGDVASAAVLAERMLARDPGNSLSQLVLGARALGTKQ